MKREKFITDFQSISEGMEVDIDFLRTGGGNANETPGGIEATARLLYSVYLYLDFYDDFTIEKMRDYLITMCKYQLYGHTFEYHFVNTAKLKIDEKYSKPWYYCESSNIQNDKLMADVFLAIGAAVKAEGTLEWIVEEFKKGTK